MKINLLGDTLWTKRYQRLPGSHPREWLTVEDMVSISSDGDLLLAMGGYLAEVDSLGSPLWISPEAKSTRITLLADGNIIGNMSDEIQSISPTGEVLWRRHYSSYGFVHTDFIRFVEVIPAKDEGYMILYNNLSGLGLMKTDCEGNVISPVACATTAITPSLPDVAFSVAHLPDRWRVSYDLPHQGATLSLCNLMGQQLESISLPARSGEVQMPYGRWASGIYLLQLRDAHGKLLGARKVLSH